MQIHDKGGKIEIKLTHPEARRWKDVIYLANRIARNVGAEEGAALTRAVVVLQLEFERCTTEEQRKKLEEQDARGIEVTPEKPLFA